MAQHGEPLPLYPGPYGHPGFVSQTGIADWLGEQPRWVRRKRKSDLVPFPAPDKEMANASGAVIPLWAEDRRSEIEQWYRQVAAADGAVKRPKPPPRSHVHRSQLSEYDLPTLGKPRATSGGPEIAAIFQPKRKAEDRSDEQGGAVAAWLDAVCAAWDRGEAPAVEIAKPQPAVESAPVTAEDTDDSFELPPELQNLPSPAEFLKETPANRTGTRRGRLVRPSVRKMIGRRPR